MASPVATDLGDRSTAAERSPRLLQIRRRGAWPRSPQAPRALPEPPLARDHKGFVPEPQTAMLLQHLLRRVEIGAIGQCSRQARIINLRDINGGIPRRPQRRSPDRLADF